MTANAEFIESERQRVSDEHRHCSMCLEPMNEATTSMFNNTVCTVCACGCFDREYCRRMKNRRKRMESKAN